MGGVPPLKGEAIERLLPDLRDWHVVDEHHLVKSYDFKDFALGLSWVNQIGQIAESEGHHPDIYLSWGKVRVEIWTNKIDGLTESDFWIKATAEALVHNPEKNPGRKLPIPQTR
jgi:4a-hydroxytetrahydrobiopterin dehydratase